MKYRTLIILIPLLLLISCGAASEAMPPATPTTAPAPTDLPPFTPTAAQPPTQTATLSPTVMAAQAESPTSTSTVEVEPTESSPPSVAPPTAEVEPTESSSPIPQASGTAGFRDNLATADQFSLQLTGVSAPPDSQVYQGWLIGDNDALASLGQLNLNPDGSVALEWNSPNSENLLSGYSRFQVTLEPAAGSARPTGEVVFGGGLETEALLNARRLFVKNEGQPATPLNTAFSLGLTAQTEVAGQHVQNAANAAAIGALAEMRAHLEHVINILEGAGGPRFGDYNGNGTAENPGDGFGVIGYAGQMAESFKNQAPVVEAAANVQAQTVAIQDKSLEIIQLDDIATASTQLGELKGLAEQLKTGPVARLYQAAQDAASFQVTALK